MRAPLESTSKRGGEASNSSTWFLSDILQGMTDEGTGHAPSPSEAFTRPQWERATTTDDSENNSERSSEEDNFVAFSDR